MAAKGLWPPFSAIKRFDIVLGGAADECRPWSERTMVRKCEVFGEKGYEKIGKIILPILVRQAKARRAITYKSLGEEIGVHYRALSYPLGAIGLALKKIGKVLGVEVPQIQAIVISGKSGVPGHGFDPFVRDRIRPGASKATRDALCEALLFEIYDFRRWDDVLDVAGISPLTLLPEPASDGLTSGEYSGVGEGDAHHKLKLYVADHPELLGLPKSCGPGMTEYKIPSGDIIDVVFRCGNNIIGVEVKSHISGDGDLCRGIWQCVKYNAVLNAMQAVDGMGGDARVVLVHQKKLSPYLTGLRNSLGVNTRLLSMANL